MDMFKFLRFEIGGAASIFWTGLFLMPYLNLVKIFELDAVDLITIFVGTAMISLPVGNYIHQIVDTILSPYAEKRCFLFERQSLNYVRKHFSIIDKVASDSTRQVVFVLSQSISTEITELKISTGSVQGHNSVGFFNIDFVRESIRNRYSYYYARIENGLFSPAAGAILAALIYHSFKNGEIFISHAQFNVLIVVVTAVICGVIMLWRIKQLFKEIDDLEILLVMVNRKNINMLLNQVASPKSDNLN